MALRESYSGLDMEAACSAAGLTVDFKGLDRASQEAWWNEQLFMVSAAGESIKSPDDFVNFIVGTYNVPENGTAKTSFLVSGSMIIGDNAMYDILKAQTISFSTAKGQCKLVITPDAIILDGTYATQYTRLTVIDTDGSEYSALAAPDYTGTVGSSSSGQIVSMEQYVVFRFKTGGGGDMQIEGVLLAVNLDNGTSATEESLMLRRLYFNSAVKTSTHTIEITYTPKQEPGGETQTTLVFKAYAGLSGRHCDPMQDTGFLHHPSARTELPAYGCGGYGGHGGGGGAGAGTVVIRKFTSGKADNVEQIAISMRHGYGSGGGAGGQGGDGCVLIFW